MSTRLLNLPSLPKWWKQEFNLFLVIIFSILIHIWCVWQLPIDYDEPIYVQAGSAYAQLIKSGDLSGIINFPENREHPPLVKILYSIPFLLFQETSNSIDYTIAARSISALFGVIAVAIIAKKNIWAGLFFCFHSMTIKYTSQAYLDSLPMLMMIVCVLFLEKSFSDQKKYFWISSIALGIAGAAKYYYLLIIFVLFVMFFFRKKFSLREIVTYFLSAFFVFILLNPNFWSEPIKQVVEVVKFHTNYSQSTHVINFGYPWYQQILHISSSVQWHPQVFFFLTSDELVFGLSLAGFYFELKEKKFSAFWFLIGIIFLLAWPTKWPQYTLLITPVMALIAGVTVSRVILWLKPREDYWNYLEEMLPQPPKITWWVLGIFVSSLVIGKIVFEYQLALSRQGWNLFNQGNSPLSSDLVFQINTKNPGTIALATDKGFDIWEQNNELNLWGDNPIRFTTENSELNTNKITNIEFDAIRNFYWLGTDLGVSKFTNEFTNYSAKDIGCVECQVNDLLIDTNFNIWISTNDGIYLFDNKNWTRFSDINKGIEDEHVLSIFLQENAGQKILWAGTLSGISKYDFSSKKWINENWAGNYFGWGGVSEIEILSDGRIAVSTLGGGIFFWNGVEWNYFRNTNAPLKSNTVQTIEEDKDHNLWFGLGYPTEPGGYLMKIGTNLKWSRYFNNNSGFAEGEPLDIQFDDKGRMWVSTNGLGVQTFFLDK